MIQNLQETLPNGHCAGDACYHGYTCKLRLDVLKFSLSSVNRLNFIILRTDVTSVEYRGVSNFAPYLFEFWGPHMPGDSLSYGSLSFTCSYATTPVPTPPSGPARSTNKLAKATTPITPRPRTKKPRHCWRVYL